MDVNTTAVDITSADGTADAIVSAPVRGDPHPGVLLFMDAFGVRPQLQQMAERLAGEGYVVLVPNLFYRNGRAPVVETGDLSGPDSRRPLFNRLRPIMAALTPERAMRDVDAYLAFLAGDRRVADRPVGTVGYCMGGALALRAAAHAPDSVAAAASFHGGRLATDESDSPHLLLDRVTAEVYAAHADRDGSMPPEQQKRLADALAAAGVRHRTEQYDGATHGFTMADTAASDEAAAERHWRNLLDLLRRTLHA